MKRLGAGIVAVLAVATGLIGAELPPLEDSRENRVAQARRYLSVSPVEDLLKDLAANMSRTMPDRQAKELEELFTKFIDVEALNGALRESMVKHYTAEELRALADFYASPVGKSAMSKFGAYMVDAMPAIQRELEKAMQRAAPAK